MRVIEAKAFGGPEVLVPSEAPDPVAGPGQVVVAVSVVDVLFVETEIRRGLGGEYFPVQPPYVPGSGVAGTVGDGRRVVAYTPDHCGGYAEQVAVPVDGLVPVPDGLDLRTAAALIHDGGTAIALIDANPIDRGERVLITGAAGGMGTLLVQLARQAGGRVVAAARGQRKLDLLRELGADEVVDYSEPGWADRVGDLNVVLDGVGGEVGRTAFELTVRGGRFSAHGSPSGEFAPIDPAEAARRGITLRGIQHVQGTGPEARQRVARALAEAAAGRLRPVIGQTFPLDRAADAHAALESRTAVGKTLLIV